MLGIHQVYVSNVSTRQLLSVLQRYQCRLKAVLYIIDMLLSCLGDGASSGEFSTYIHLSTYLIGQGYGFYAC